MSCLGLNYDPRCQVPVEIIMNVHVLHLTNLTAMTIKITYNNETHVEGINYRGKYITGSFS